MIIVPSIAEEMISIFPWPKGWFLSAGFADR